MGLLDKLRGEFVDIVEWVDDTNHTLVWRFPRYQNEIKNGAQLIVRPGQVALFVDRGRIADVFQPGMYSLTTANLPILSTLQGWKFGFESPFKAECYFISTRQITDLKWGTPQPIMLRDADFGPIRLRAFGTYALKAADPRALLTGLVGTDGVFEADEVGELLRSLIATSFAQLVGEAHIAALDLAANYQQLSEQLRKRVQEKIDDEYGLELPQCLIVNVSLPPEVEKALDTRSSIGVMGDLGKFQQYQLGQAMLAGAQNPGGLAAAGAGIGVGMAMAQQMGQAMAPAAPPPPPVPPFFVAVNGQTQGPFPLAQLAQAIQSGQVQAATLVYGGGTSAWTPASQVPVLAPYFAAPPPPPPPPPPPAK
ncbi:MAG: SPFH domain-containing protein [Deltaproteobacteria bacterium]|nr:SPFH domain-containing protein [Deltaproteobacteria bacterium]